MTISLGTCYNAEKVNNQLLIYMSYNINMVIIQKNHALMNHGTSTEVVSGITFSDQWNKLSIKIK